MKVGLILGIFCAVLLHLGILLFGGLIFHSDKPNHGTLQQVELLDATEDKKEKLEDPEPEKKELEADAEQAPDAAEIIRNLEKPQAIDAPALEAASLSAIEQALNGSGGGGDFSEALSFSSGGRIGGTGAAGVSDQKIEDAFNLSEIDQKPRAIFQESPVYPGEMRGKKLEGVVSLVFVVDAAGKVDNARVEKSSNPAFETPALNAIRRWKFEPGVRAGQRVASKMRISIRFPPN